MNLPETRTAVIPAHPLFKNVLFTLIAFMIIPLKLTLSKAPPTFDKIEQDGFCQSKIANLL